MEERAAHRLVSLLAAAGTDRVFCVPGESYLTALDAFRDREDIQLVACRHEGGAGFMALADAKLTGRPGIVFVSRGPGAMNAAIALHAAEQDATPLILFIGHVARDEIGRGAFQEVDYGKTFADIAKAVLHVADGHQMGRIVGQAWHTATAGTPGPVVVVLPEDMLADAVGEEAATPPRPAPLPRAEAADLAAVAERLARARKPLLIAGGQLGTDRGRAALRAAAERWGLPVLGGFKQQDLMPNAHPNWAGQIGFVMPPPLSKVLVEADLVLAVGTRLGDITSQHYTFPAAPVPAQDVVHVYPDAAAIGRNIAPWRGVVADGAAFLEGLAGLDDAGTAADRAAWIEAATAVNRGLMAFKPKPCRNGVDFGAVIDAVARHATDDAIFTLDSGNFASWVHRFLPLRGGQRMIGTSSGAMGGGIPSAVAAALRYPGRQVVAFAGDGGLMMTGNEVATALLHQASVKVIVADNGSYGTIRTHQEKAFPGRTVATDLSNPDFATWARSFTMAGLTLDSDSAIDAVVAEALGSPASALVHVRQSLERLTAFSP